MEPRTWGTLEKTGAKWVPGNRILRTHAQVLKFHGQSKSYADGEKRTPVG
jgi:hypothetical protein